MMQVLKFGGTSVGSADRMKHVASIVTNDEVKKVVVLSAVSGTTNTLYEVAEHVSGQQEAKIERCLNLLKKQYNQYISELFEEKEHGKGIVEDWIADLAGLTKRAYTRVLQNEIVAMGEKFSTRVFTQYLKSMGVNSTLLMAPDFISLNSDGEPDVSDIGRKLNPVLDEGTQVQIWVTQGFICKDHQGLMSNLKRGGSDYSASLIGAAICAEEIQIWTDIDGMHNNDPRVVKNTKPIAKLSFVEAAELAYFGAKILHPATVQPAKQAEINVRIKNTLAPEMPGTLITRVKNPTKAEVKAIAAKDNITAIKIRSSRMLMAYGFLRKVFEIFEKFKTPIDMITTSEVAVSITIDDLSSLYEIISELETFGEVEVDYDQSIVCIVGNMVVEDKGLVAKVFQSLDQTPIRMISYGGSRNNISILIPSKYKSKALNALNQGLFL